MPSRAGAGAAALALLLCVSSVCLAAEEHGAGHGSHDMTGAATPKAGTSSSASASTGAETVWQNEEHWASAGCTTLTSSHHAAFNEKCHTCVDKTKGHGDPTRCHSCLKSHKGHHLSPDLAQVCLACVPTAENKRLGWACAQYCTHHGIVNTTEQANDCIGCLMAEHPTDKWGCHVCMEQVMGDMAARRDCFKCMAGKKNAYQCAFCARVASSTDRATCFACMEKGGTGKACAGNHGVGEWINPNIDDKAKALFKKIGLKLPHERDAAPAPAGVTA